MMTILEDGTDHTSDMIVERSRIRGFCEYTVEGWTDTIVGAVAHKSAIFAEVVAAPGNIRVILIVLSYTRCTTRRRGANEWCLVE